MTRLRTSVSVGVSLLYATLLTVLLGTLVPMVEHAGSTERRRLDDLEAVAGAVLAARRAAETRRGAERARARPPAGRLAGADHLPTGTGDKAPSAAGATGGSAFTHPEPARRGRREAPSPGDEATSTLDGDVEAIRRAMLRALVRGCVLVAIVAGGAALALGLLLRSTLHRIAAAAERLSEQRAPIEGVGPCGWNEFGRLHAAVAGFPALLLAMRERMDRTIAGMAHDLRTPMTRIRLSVEAAQAAVSDGRRTAVEAELERVLARCDALTELFGSLLRISETQRADGSDLGEPIDLAELAGSMFEAYEPAIEDGGRILTLQADGPAWAVADRPLVCQAVANLLDNANLHTPAGTRIDLVVVAGAEGSRVTVRDDGPGVAEPDRSRLADPFFRAGGTRAVAGHGLGLSMVAAVAKAHRGSIRIDGGERGTGLDVSLVLPPTTLRAPCRTP